jgi:hypothetical protein
VKKQKESREEKMSQIQEKLLNSTREIFESEKYAQYISTMAKFPNYSINNCILIASQCPDASYVCGYKKWQLDFNRAVNRNEHGIMIIAPVKYKADVDELVYDNDQHPVLDSDGNQKKEKVTKEFKGFRPAYVFDVQQTSGDPLPTLATLLDASVDGYEQLKGILEKISPVPVLFDENTGGANGYFSPSKKEIVIKKDLPQLQTIKTMIHEIAHASLGHGGKEDKWDRSSKEVQAESVAYWVASMFDFDTSDYSLGYIAGWSKDKEVSELKESLEIIKKTADKISSDIEKELLVANGQKKENVESEPVAEIKEERVRKKVR